MYSFMYQQLVERKTADNRANELETVLTSDRQRQLATARDSSATVKLYGNKQSYILATFGNNFIPKNDIGISNLQSRQAQIHQM